MDKKAVYELKFEGSLKDFLKKLSPGGLESDERLDIGMILVGALMNIGPSYKIRLYRGDELVASSYKNPEDLDPEEEDTLFIDGIGYQFMRELTENDKHSLIELDSEPFTHPAWKEIITHLYVRNIGASLHNLSVLGILNKTDRHFGFQRYDLGNLEGFDIKYFWRFFND